MKKVLYIHHSSGWGGAPISMINTINSLDKSEYEVKVLLLKDSIVREKLLENKIPHFVATGKFYRKYYRYYTHIVPSIIPWYNIKKQLLHAISWLMSRYIFSEIILKGLNYDFDIVHLNSSVLTDWLKPCSKLGKVVMHIREPVSKGYIGLRYNIFRGQMKKYADQIVAISNDNAKRINLPHKTTVVYNFSFIDKIHKLSVSKYSTNKVLYLGGGALIKGYEAIVNSLKYLDKDIEIYFGGSYINFEDKLGSGFFEKIKKRIKKIKNYKLYKLYTIIAKSPNAIMIGMILDVNTLIDKSVCLVSPFSKLHFSRPVIESYSRRKPVIATDLPGIDEIVQNNKTGYLVPVNSAKELAERINFICKNPVDAKKMGDNGYAVALERFSETNAKSIEKMYKRILR